MHILSRLMVDLAAIAADLEDVARARGDLEVAVENAQVLMELPRYAGDHGRQLLAADIREAVAALPPERIYPGTAQPQPLQKDARTLLPDRAARSWSARVRNFKFLGSGDYGTSMWYARYLLLEIASGIARALERNPKEGFEWVKYRWRRELREDDPRVHVDTRDILVRALLPGQDVVKVRHYYDGEPQDPELEATSADHRYIGRLPVPDTRTPWWDNFVHIGRPYEVGETFTLSIRATYRDEGDGRDSGALRLLADPGLIEADLGVRLPAQLRDIAPAEWQVRAHPESNPDILARGDVDPSGSWFFHVFTDVTEYLEYSLSFPGLNPYPA